MLAAVVTYSTRACLLKIGRDGQSSWGTARERGLQ